MLGKIDKSLRLKWMLFSILLSTLPLVVASYSIIQIHQENLKQSVITIEKDKADMVVGRTRAYYEKIRSNLCSLSVDEDFRQGGAPGHIEKLLKDFLYQNDSLSELCLMDEKGKERIKV